MLGLPVFYSPPHAFARFLRETVGFYPAKTKKQRQNRTHYRPERQCRNHLKRKKHPQSEERTDGCFFSVISINFSTLFVLYPGHTVEICVDTVAPLLRVLRLVGQPLMHPGIGLLRQQRHPGGAGDPQCDRSVLGKRKGGIV